MGNTSTTILLATANPHKAAELQWMLEDVGIEVLTLADLPSEISGEQVEEDEPTLEGNALKKARYWADRSGLSTLADDTGLEVEALGGAPGVFSARYAGEDATYEDNVRKLLAELQGTEERKAQFRTVLALISSEGEYLFDGRCEGVILDEIRGAGGFGYDPIFLPLGFKKTFAEMDATEKNAISHRGRALQAFVEWVKQQK